MKKWSSLFILTLVASRLSFAAVYSVGLDKTQYTSDYMIGKVIVSIIFPESDGSVDPNSETWSNERKTQVVNEIMTGLDWWTKQNQKSPLSFSFISQTVTTKYEPITRPYYDESLWIPEIMSKLGYTGSRFTATRKYVNELRDRYHADWGFVIFVVDSLGDSNGKFTDGLFAYAYLGGPFLVMTYDNNGYGIANMDVVVAHESGHIFNALDQYAGASSPNDYSYGYFPTINGNHAYATTATEPDSIMRGGIRWKLDDYARKMIGWNDKDNNNRDDILDVTPTVVLNTQSLFSSGSTGMKGKATIGVLPRQSNSNGYGFNTDSILSIEYQVQDDQWTQAATLDGKFDTGQEEFNMPISAALAPRAQALSAQDFKVRVVTAVSQFNGSTSGGGFTAPSTLDSAHVYPNPYKPGVNVNHTTINFTGLTSGAKIQVFSPNGEPVFEKEVDSGAADYAWNAKNDQGTVISSGVYLYLITDPDGHMKKGKLAVIR